MLDEDFADDFSYSDPVPLQEFFGGVDFVLTPVAAFVKKVEEERERPVGKDGENYDHILVGYTEEEWVNWSLHACWRPVECWR